MNIISASMNRSISCPEVNDHLFIAGRLAVFWRNLIAKLCTAKLRTPRLLVGSLCYNDYYTSRQHNTFSALLLGRLSSYSW
jgi:hypothetical protein